MSMFRFKNKAFTLLELLIVIAIIGILMIALLPVITKGPREARDTARIAAVNDIAVAVEKIVLDGGQYPSQTATDNTDCLDFSAGAGLSIAQSMKKIPTVSKVSSATLCSDTGEQFFYKSLSANGNYFIAVEVELADNANGDSSIADAGAVRGWSDGNAILSAIDKNPVDSAAPYFYVVVK